VVVEEREEALEAGLGIAEGDPTTGFDELALRSEVGGSSDSQGLGAALVHHSPGTRA